MKYIYRFVFVIFMLFTSCSSNNNANKASSEEQSKVVIVENQSTIDSLKNVKSRDLHIKCFDVDIWLENMYNIYSINDDLRQIISRSFHIYKTILSTYISENDYYSEDLILDEKKCTDFINYIIMGKVSSKSLEQIINQEIDSYLLEHPNVKINHISLCYFTHQALLPKESIKYLEQQLITIKSNEDFKRKERKQKYLDILTTEILKNVCGCLIDQNLFTQF